MNLDRLIRLHSKRPPDFVIGGAENPYLLRWHIVPREKDTIKVYLHNQLRDDDDRAMHDHPSDNVSMIIKGGYRELTPMGEYLRGPGDIITRRGPELHRLVLHRRGDRPVPSWSLFIMGATYREWGFQCGDRWVHWKEFCDPGNTGLAGRGCD